MTSLIRLVVPSSMPFIRRDQRGVGGRGAARPVGEVAAQRLRRHGEHDQLGAVERLGGVGGGGDPLGQRARRAGSRGCAGARGCAAATASPAGPDVTSRPASARTLANAVPQEPAPSTATRSIAGSSAGLRPAGCRPVDAARAAAVHSGGGVAAADLGEHVAQRAA